MLVEGHVCFRPPSQLELRRGRASGRGGTAAVSWAGIPSSGSSRRPSLKPVKHTVLSGIFSGLDGAVKRRNGLDPSLVICFSPAFPGCGLECDMVFFFSIKVVVFKN